jgi:hypothetical protein
VFDRGEKLPSLAEFPAGFAAQLQSFREALTKPTIFGSQMAHTTAQASPRGGLAKRLSGRRSKPLSPVTADGYARNLVLVAGYLVSDGPLSSISLRWGRSWTPTSWCAAWSVCRPISGHVTRGAHREFAMASGEMSDDEFLAFNMSWMKLVLQCLCEGGVFGSFID